MSIPFLSIVTRTQGKRPVELKELFDCFEKQSNQNFEVVVVAHKMTQPAFSTVHTIISHVSEQLRGKLKLLQLNTGNRTAPLNFGFKATSGQYIVAIDDDDIIYPDYIEEFYQLSLGNANKILHCYVEQQYWERRENREKSGYSTAAVGEKNYLYCKNFNWLEQLASNGCPLHSVAFPARVFQIEKIQFDETLSTNEDWDYLMRVVFLCGVVDTPAITAQYRKWRDQENSVVVHNSEEWQQNLQCIYKKLNQRQLTFPIGIAGQIADLVELNRNQTEEIRKLNYIVNRLTYFEEQLELILNSKNYQLIQKIQNIKIPFKESIKKWIYKI